MCWATSRGTLLARSSSGCPPPPGPRRLRGSTGSRPPMPAAIRLPCPRSAATLAPACLHAGRGRSAGMPAFGLNSRRLVAEHTAPVTRHDVRPPVRPRRRRRTRAPAARLEQLAPLLAQNRTQAVRRDRDSAWRVSRPTLTPPIIPLHAGGCLRPTQPLAKAQARQRSVACRERGRRCESFNQPSEGSASCGSGPWPWLLPWPSRRHLPGA